MGNNSFNTTSVAAAPHEWRRHLHRGWVDAQNGNRWPDDYDVMSRQEQIAYEQGRLLAREAIAEGFALPVWRGDKAGADIIDELWRSVCARLGRRVTPDEVKYAAEEMAHD